MNILDRIVASKAVEVQRSKQAKSHDDIRGEARAVTRKPYSLKEALSASPTGIIAEFKRRSPSKGDIKAGAGVASVVPGYAAAGAAAVSVLTDSLYFGGSLDDLREARRLVDIPLLRKDFVVDAYQICEARLAGADAILLIAAALSPERTAELAFAAHELQLEVLLEIHNTDELGHIGGNIDVVGVNNRDLKSFVTDTTVSKRLAADISGHHLKISESGISDPGTVKELRGYGYRGFLMGENFMKEADPARALAEFIAAL